MTPVEVLILSVGTFALTVPATMIVRDIAMRRGIIDRPSSRSSHTVPTPRGGGLAMVVAYFSALLVLHILDELDVHELIALMGGGGAVAVVGFLDDRSHVPATIRFLVHLAAAVMVVTMIGGLRIVGSDGVPAAPWIGALIAVIGIAWAVNLFNFMDGIDGIAASEAAFVSAAAGTLIFVLGGSLGLVASFAALAATSLGFLVWNWPPARIFMGDVGSGFLGFILATLAIITTRRMVITVSVWPILWGVFLVDASVTLLRRMLHGDKWYEAHRTHAYQHLARERGGHLATTVLVCAINVCWLLPWAWHAALHSSSGGVCAAAALAPLIAGAIWAGAGKS